jgi:uncharacterized membrane protein
MTSSHAFALSFLIGLLCGLRALTPPAVTAWGAYLGWLKVSGRLAWVGSLPSVIILTVLAVGELINDKLPKTPARTAPMGLVPRILTSAFTGACVACAAGQMLVIGACCGVVGALVGTFGGYHARKGLVKALGSPDFVVAVVEDLVAIGGSLWVVTRF